MKTTTLDAPLTINPAQAVKVVPLTTTIDHAQRVLRASFRLVNAQGATLEDRHVTIGPSAAVEAWIDAREAQILGYVAQHLGVTGTTS